jgi:hypothetical protein
MSKSWAHDLFVELSLEIPVTIVISVIVFVLLRRYKKGL